VSAIDSETQAAQGAVAVGMDRQRRLMWLLFARLVISGVSLGVAIGLEALGRRLPPDALQGLYWTVATAFLATAVSGLFTRKARMTQRFADAQIALDVGIVSALVHFSGAHESVFTFLYVLVTLYGAVLFGKRRAFGAATLSALGYAVVLAVGFRQAADPQPLAMLAALWAIHVGALFLVGALASTLSGELQRTGAALDRSTSDLRRLRDLHRHTVDSLMSGLLTTDSEGRVTSFNPEAERITGAALAAVLGCDVDAVIPGARQLLLDSPGRDRSSAKPRRRLAYRNSRGQDLHLGLAGSVLRGEGREPNGFVVIFQDVTSIVAMEADLRRSERLAAVGEMAANMAHEVRNPLAAISGSIEVLRTDVAGQSSGLEVLKLMDIAIRETERLDALIADFLTYARPAPLARKQILLSELVGEVATMFESVRPPEVELELDLEPGLEVGVDPDQIRQVLWNLCLNASQAMPGGGTLRIETALACEEISQAAPSERRQNAGGDFATPGFADWVEIRVVDTGVGISAELREQIFEPFFTTRAEGSGLGLAMVHRIVDSHGGSLQLESEIDRGTSFRIRLPRASVST
jgi:two-component system sensor histidine kinase PilS (NtrC family)